MLGDVWQPEKVQCVKSCGSGGECFYSDGRNYVHTMDGDMLFICLSGDNVLKE